MLPSLRYLPLFVVVTLLIGDNSINDGVLAFVVPSPVLSKMSRQTKGSMSSGLSTSVVQMNKKANDPNDRVTPGFAFGFDLDLIDDLVRQWQRTVASGLAATTIALLAAGITLDPMPAVAAPETSNVVQLSKGAIVVQTTAGDNLVKSSIDSKSLLKTLFVNRQALTASLERIQATIAQELSTPVWKEISKEFLDVEGDLAGLVKVIPPSDLKETVKDLAAGKVNFLVNGEVVNVAVVPTFGDQEDDLVISIKGFKGEKVFRFEPEAAAPRYGPIRSYFSKYEGFWTWWETPFPSQYLLPNMNANNGDVIVVGTIGSIWFIYLSAYGYYQYEKEQEILAAEAKRLETEQKKQKAAAAKKKAKKEESSDDVKKNAKKEEPSDAVAKKEEPSPDVVSEAPKKTKRRRLMFWRKGE